MSEPITSAQIAEACKEKIPEEEFEDFKTDIIEMEVDEAIGYAFSVLIDYGVDDPEAFLKEKGVLE